MIAKLMGWDQIEISSMKDDFPSTELTYKQFLELLRDYTTLEPDTITTMWTKSLVWYEAVKAGTIVTYKMGSPDPIPPKSLSTSS